MKPATIKHVRSSGGVVFRKREGSFEVALIATKNKTVWTLPKGLIDKGEGPEAAALREIGEETGLKGRVMDALGERSYWFYLKDENVKFRKTVSYFLFECVGGNIEDFGWEVDDARWFPVEEAIEKVSYRSDREILGKAREKLSRMARV